MSKWKSLQLCTIAYFEHNIISKFNLIALSKFNKFYFKERCTERKLLIVENLLFDLFINLITCAKINKIIKTSR